MDFTAWKNNDFRFHLEQLGVKKLSDWQRICPLSYEAAKKKDRACFRGIVEGIIQDTCYQTLKRKPIITANPFDYCVQKRLTTSAALLKNAPHIWKNLGAANTPYWWQGIRIVFDYS